MKDKDCLKCKFMGGDEVEDYCEYFEEIIKNTVLKAKNCKHYREA